MTRHYGERFDLPVSGEFIPAVEAWGQSPRLDISLVRDSAFRQTAVAEMQARRLRWVYHHTMEELESPAYLTEFDIRGYNAILAKVEQDGKDIKSVVLHLSPEVAHAIAGRLHVYKFERNEARGDVGIPDLAYVGPPTRWKL